MMLTLISVLLLTKVADLLATYTTINTGMMDGILSVNW